jgi:pre-rRNA-processing protein TSR2
VALRHPASIFIGAAPEETQRKKSFGPQALPTISNSHNTLYKYNRPRLTSLHLPDFLQLTPHPGTGHTKMSATNPLLATQSSSANYAQPQPTPQKISAHTDLAISLTLHLWPALTLAVQNEWGGPSSSDKRDWFAGAISDLFISNPQTDAQDLEDFMEQIMGDEFECVVDDGSLEEAAGAIVRLREQCLRGEFGEVETLQRTWEENKRRGETGNSAGPFRKVEVDQETDDEDGDEDGDGEEDEDEVMGEAPELVRAPWQKVKPEVDEEGFTKVVGKRNR